MWPAAGHQRKSFRPNAATALPRVGYGCKPGMAGGFIT